MLKIVALIKNHLCILCTLCTMHSSAMSYFWGEHTQAMRATPTQHNISEREINWPNPFYMYNLPLPVAIQLLIVTINKFQSFPAEQDSFLKFWMETWECHPGLSSIVVKGLGEPIAKHWWWYKRDWYQVLRILWQLSFQPGKIIYNWPA